MRRWILWAIFAVPALAWADSAEDVAAATRAWAAAYNSHDPQQILARYAADAVFWGTGSETLRYSRAAILDYFRNMPNRPNARVSIGDHRVRVYGDIAIDTGLYTFTDVVDDASVTRPARFSFTYRLHDGEWLIVDHHCVASSTSGQKANGEMRDFDLPQAVCGERSYEQRRASTIYG